MTTRFSRVRVWMDAAIGPEEGVVAGRLVSGASVTCVGMYVEDPNLDRLASLPVARGVSREGLEFERIDREALRRQIEARLVALDRRFRRIAGPGGRVARVKRSDLFAALGPGELLVVSRPDAATWVGTDWADLLSRGRCDVLFVNQPWATGRSVLVYAQDAESGARAVAIGDDLAAREGLESHLLMPEAAASPDAPVEHCEPTAEDLLAACRRLDARLLIVPASIGLNWGEVSRWMLEMLDSSLLVLRDERDHEASSETVDASSL